MEEKKEFILITGASSGMGREIALKLSSQYNIVLNGRNSERLEEAKNHCDAANYHLIWKYDLENAESIEKSFSDFMNENQIQISHFVHCAGMMKNYPLKMINFSLFQNSFNVNVISAALITKILTNRKLNSKALKSIVLISSNISNFGAKSFTIYGSSKGALDAFMRSAAMELAPHVRVNSVLPGGVKTAMTEHLYDDPELIKRMEASYPLGLGGVEDIYEAVHFLLSDKAKWITGQQLTVDGGRTTNITG